MDSKKIARGLGWFSLGLGLTEVVAPGRLGRALGMQGGEGLLRFYGLREIAAGVGLVSQRQAAPAWLLARVGGDALDLVTLTATLLRPDNPKRGNAAFALAAVAGITALDVLCARDLGLKRSADGTAQAGAVVTIGRPPGEVYAAWRAPETLPKIMQDFADVTPDGDHTHWAVHAPVGGDIEMDTHVVEDRPGELLRWETAAGAGLPHTASVEFRAAPNGLGTEVAMCLRFDPPGGAAGQAAAPLLEAVPAAVALKALRRFKSLIETGEIPTIQPQPAGRADDK